MSYRLEEEEEKVTVSEEAKELRTRLGQVKFILLHHRVLAVFLKFLCTGLSCQRMISDKSAVRFENGRPVYLHHAFGLYACKTNW